MSWEKFKSKINILYFSKFVMLKKILFINKYKSEFLLVLEKLNIIYLLHTFRNFEILFDIENNRRRI